MNIADTIRNILNTAVDEEGMSLLHLINDETPNPQTLAADMDTGFNALDNGLDMFHTFIVKSIITWTPLL